MEDRSTLDADSRALRVLSREELEDEVRRRTAALENVMNTMAEILLKLDETGRIEMANDAVAAVLGYENVEGKPLDFLFAPPEDDEGLAEMLTHGEVVERLYADGVVRDVEVTFETAEGERIPMNFSASLLREDGQVTGFVCVASDIREIKAREREIRLLNELFGRVLRHNMRNELSAITMAAEGITELEEQRLESVRETILACSQNLMQTGEKARLIADVIYEYADRASVDLVASARETVADARGEYEHATVELDATVERAPTVCHEAIDIALENLIENAVQHHHRDDPWVEVRVDANDDRVVLEVADDGPGIPEHELDVLERGEETPLLHGSGAGLWLVDWIVRRSDGELSFDRRDGTTIVRIELRPATWDEEETPRAE